MMAPKKPARLAETVHLDDFMDFKRQTNSSVERIDRDISSNWDDTERAIKSGLDDCGRDNCGKIGEIEKRLREVERKDKDREKEMTDFGAKLSAIDKAIMGDMEKPEQPGMAENLRTLVRLHENEDTVVKKTLLSDMSWKAMLIAMTIISSLVAIIWKILPYLENAAQASGN